MNPRWLDVANRLVILFDDVRGIHPEYKGYVHETIKQADVVLLGFPLGFNMSAAVRQNDLLFYAPVTSLDGPAMTWGMHAIGFVDLKNFSVAAPLFNQSFANAQTPFYVWTETPKGGAVNFLTGAGGFLQTVTFGYPGLRLTSAALTLDPELPEGAQRVVVRGVWYQGYSFSLAYDSTVMTVTVALFGPTSKLTLTDGTGQHYLTPKDATLTLPRGPAAISVGA